MIDLIYNLSLLVALSVISGFISQRWAKNTWHGEILQGTLFGCTAMLGMVRPLVLAPGLIFDGRSVMISLCGLFFGLQATLIAVLLTGFLRLWQGGIGATVGVMVILSSALIGLLSAHLRKASLADTRALDLYFFGLAVHVAMLLIMLLLPFEMAMQTLRSIGLPVMLTYPLATVLIGKILSDQERNTQTINALRTSEARYRFLADNTSDVLWIFNFDTQAWDYISPSVSRLRGYSAEEVQRQTLAQVLSPQSLSSISNTLAERAALLQHHPERPHTYTDEVEQTCKDGTTVCAEIASRFTYNDRHERIVIGVSRNIQERKLAEVRMKASQEALQSSEDRYKALLQSVPDLLFLLDRQGVFRDYHANDPAKLMVKPEQFLNRPVNEILPPEIAAQTMQLLATLFETGSHQQYEYALHLPDGKRFFENRLFPCGKDLALSIIRDITDLKTSEEEKLQLLQQVHQSQKLESLGVLAGGIAHDFNNILMGILGNVELAEVDVKPGSPVLSRLGKITAAAQRAAELCRQMLTYSGSSSLSCESIVLPLLVPEIIRLLKSNIPAKTAVRLDFSTPLPPIFADPYQIRQMLRHLIINASESITHDHGLIMVSAVSRRYTSDDLAATELAPTLPAGEYIAVSVEDNGCGMSAETRRRMFEPFYSTKFVGRGLGLASVLGIVRAHSGAIIIDSQPEKGTRIQVLLPTAKGLQNSDVPSTPPASSPRPTILFADDEESLRDIAQVTLQRLGYQVLLARTGQEAIDLYKTHRQEVRVTILDLSMPGMDGIQTLDELRHLDPNALVIIASGYSEEDIRDRFVSQAPSAVLQKPFTMSQLKTVFARLNLQVLFQPSVRT
ncbi:MAG TPA: LytS/YhcK type 5TM receptor domain-containing protein [Candidatus Ozemobacteraceae bacterium]|nr:LytS/YhcK type 5TM receptor domain-containing protein [Candidatus Ozemobacteraceae bacterium]